MFLFVRNFFSRLLDISLSEKQVARKLSKNVSMANENIISNVYGIGSVCQ